jgi:hypothetical protein
VRIIKIRSKAFVWRKEMIVTIANISTQIGAAELQAAIAAIGDQVNQHFIPEWGVTATLNSVVTALKGKAPIQGHHDAIIYLGDSSQDPTTGVSGALGYHSINHADIPYGFVYLDISAEYGEVWTCTLSHEVLELLADPDAALTVTGPAPAGILGDVYYDFEVCDPTQGDSYTIDNVNVSNFVGRKYFGLTGGSGKTNYLNLPLGPFGVSPGGYFQYEDASGAHQVQGQKVTQRQLTAKKRMKNGRRNARRVERICKSMSEQGENMSKVAEQSKSQETSSRNGHSLRVVLATNPELRRKVYQAATTAAHNVLKEAGVSVTTADIADARADFAAMKLPSEPPIKADTAGDIIDGVGTAASIAIALGF